MTPSRESSFSSNEGRALGELTTGSTVAGFRVERTIGRGARGIVYEATQIGLERRVALRLLPADPALEPRFRRMEWPEHPHAVRLYAAGAWEDGYFLATQLVPGTTLANLHASGKLERGRLPRIFEEIGSALDAAHRAGIVHGNLSARSVFVRPDGRALLSDFGLGGPDASAASDQAALAALARKYLATGPRVPHRRTAVAGVGAVLAVAALVAALRASSADPERALTAIPGAEVLGSALPADGVESVDCEGDAPSGGSPSCVATQVRLPGHPLRVARAGAVRRWSVRGARGELALQILRPRGQTFELIARTPDVRVADAGTHTLAANLPVRTGDLVGLRVAPGAGLGVRRADGAATARLFGSQRVSANREQRGAGTGFDHEILLRVEYLPGARVTSRGLLTGSAAERAPAGRELITREIEPRAGQVREVALVALGSRTALDLIDGTRRLVRLPLADVNARGRLLEFETVGEPTISLRWRNPDGGVVSHGYTIGSRSLVPIS